MSFWQSKSSKERENQANINQQNIESAERINQSNIDWQREYFDKVNEYNTPTMQMQRFKEAGLNPHLIYGQGTSGNTTMPTAPDKKFAEAKGTVGTAQGWEDWANLGLSAAQQYVATQQQIAQTQNTEAQTQVAMAQKQNVDSQTVANYMNSAKTSQETEQSSQLFANKVATAEAGLNNLTTQTKSIEQQIASSKTGQKLSEEQIKKTAQEIKESSERVKLLQMQGDNLGLDKELKQLDIQLKKVGINPQDPTWMRMLFQNIEGIGGAVSGFWSDGYDGVMKAIERYKK